jgi:hypothetical protein
MPPRHRQLTPLNIDGYLSQINTNSSPDTIIKIKCKAAFTLIRVGDKLNTKRAIDLFNEAYNIQRGIRGTHHPRTLNILNSLIYCENKLIKNKKK